MNLIIAQLAGIKKEWGRPNPGQDIILVPTEQVIAVFTRLAIPIPPG